MPRGPAPEVDLAFRLETSEGDPLPAALAGLLEAAGPFADAARAEGHWQELLAGWLAQLIDDLPADLRSTAYSLGLLLTDDASIAALNNTWRQRNEPTDVLSFAALESDLEDGPPLPLLLDLFEAAGKVDEFEEDNEDAEEDWLEDEDNRIVPDGLDPERGGALERAVALEPSEALESGGEPLELGDIVISLETAARQAEAAGSTLEAELLFLASHGLLHLLGWDHPDEASLTAMLGRQEALIAGGCAQVSPLHGPLHQPPGSPTSQR